jgi:hypothetical protein
MRVGVGGNVLGRGARTCTFLLYGLTHLMIHAC